jgi:hypothetical protein
MAGAGRAGSDDSGEREKQAEILIGKHTQE